MADFSEVFFSSISEINAGLKAKNFSAVELTRAFCDRLEKYGPTYNALVVSLRQEAIKKAKEVDSDLKIDRTRGPLQGIPFGVKDLLAVRNHPTTWGAKPYESQVFKEDALIIRAPENRRSSDRQKNPSVGTGGRCRLSVRNTSLTRPEADQLRPFTVERGSSSRPGAAATRRRAW